MRVLSRDFRPRTGEGCDKARRGPPPRAWRSLRRLTPTSCIALRSCAARVRPTFFIATSRRLDASDVNDTVIGRCAAARAIIVSPIRAFDQPVPPA